MFILCSLFHFTVQQNEEGHIWVPHPDHCDCDTYPMYSILLVIKHTTDSMEVLRINFNRFNKTEKNQNRTTCLTFNQFQDCYLDEGSVSFFTKVNTILLVLYM